MLQWFIYLLLIIIIIIIIIFCFSLTMICWITGCHEQYHHSEALEYVMNKK